MVASTSGKSPDEEVVELRKQETVLLGRLNRGDDKIWQARARGEDVRQWEDLYVDLLHQYESVYDKLTLLEAGQ